MILSPLLTLGFPKNSFLNRIYTLQLFQMLSAIIILELVDVVVRCGGGEVFYNIMIKSQSYSGLVFLDCGLYKSPPPHPLTPGGIRLW